MSPDSMQHFGDKIVAEQPVILSHAGARSKSSGGCGGRRGVVGGGGRRGGSSQAIVRALADQGARLLLVDKEASVLEFAREIEESTANGETQVLGMVGDLTEPSVCELAVAESIDAFGDFDFVLAVAGGSDPRVPVACENTKPDHYRLLFEKNLISAVNLMAAAVPHLKAGRGRRDMVCFSTTNGTSGWAWAGEPALAGAKAAVEAVARIWASELRPFGVSVNCIRPGSIPNPHSPVWAERLCDPRCQQRLRELYRTWGPLIAEQVGVEVGHLLDVRSAPRTGQTIVLDPSGIGTLGTEDPSDKWWLSKLLIDGEDTGEEPRPRRAK